MEKRKPNDLPPEQCLAVDTDTLCKLLCCGRHTAVQIGDLANARITMNTRVLWSVQRIKEYLYDISGYLRVLHREIFHQPHKPLFYTTAQSLHL